MSRREPRIRGLNHAVCTGARAASSIAGKIRAATLLLGFAILATFCILPAAAGQDGGPAGGMDGGLELEKVADLIHTIVASNREAYSQIVVNRLTIQEKVIKADEQYLSKRALLLPAQFFRAGAELAAKSNGRAAYSLQSFWSIHPQNFPKSEQEKIGLARVLGGTGQFYGTESSGSEKYFIAAYPDVATNQACVTCHNNHPDSRRQDFAIGDVMGGVVVRIPLLAANSRSEGSGGAANSNADQSPKMDYRDAADLVHSIVAANREAYASLVVDRLAGENAIQTDEHYIEKKCLPLPVQLFNLGAMLAGGKTRTATFSLRSAWPLNKANLPASDAEKAGLAAVARGKDRFYTVEASGTGKTLVAVYPDIAVNASCAACHNQHENSPRKDFKPGDAMGGVVVRIPMTH